jgi:membrane fusion protein (multidrug efflux system)
MLVAFMFSKKRKILISFGLFLLILTIYAISKNFFHVVDAPDVKVVETYTIIKRPIESSVELIGAIKAQRYAVITAAADGVLQIHQELEANSANHKFSKGAMIASIANSNIRNSYDIAKDAEDVASSQFDRSAKLFKSGVVSQRELEEKKSRLFEAQKNLTDAQIAFDKTNIMAPFDGIVGVFKLRSGAHIKIGDVVLSFYDPTNLVVELNLPTSLVKELNESSKAVIFDKTYPLNQNIKKIVDSETGMCPVQVQLNCHNCFVGEAIDVKIIVAAKADSIVVPFDAVLTENAQHFVYVIAENKVLKREVQLGIRQKEMVEITSGLNYGEEVVSIAPNRLRDGIQVQKYNKES